MILGEALAPAAGPALADIAIGLGVVVTFLFLYGASKGYDYSFGALLRKMGDVFRAKIPLIGVGVPGGGKVASAFDKVDDIVRDALAAGLVATETALAKWWHAQEALVRYTYDALAYFAGETHNAIDSLVHGTIPQAVGAATKPVTVGLGKLGVKLTALERTFERRLTLRAQALEAEIDRDFGKAWRGIDHLRGSLSGTIAHGLGIAEAQIHVLNRRFANLVRGRVHRLEMLLAGGVLTAVAIAALTRVFPYWKCTNVRRLMRGTCRANPAWLELLFGAGIEALIVADLCDFIAGVSVAAKAAEPALLAFVEVEDVLIGCHGASKPPPLPLAPLGIPASTTGIALGV